MKASRMEQATRVFFWIGYGVFLAASIPHIATYFRHFDPMQTPFDWFYWLIGYALALVIDISDVLVSIAVIKAQASGARRKDLLGYWLFIVFITALSWCMNWQYNVVFGSAQFHSVDTYTIFRGVAIGQINPVIGSAFQLLLLVYTGMAHKFSQKSERKETSLEELQKQATEATQRAALLKQIQQAHPSLISKLTNTALEVKGAVQQVMSNEQEIQDIKTEISDMDNHEECAVVQETEHLQEHLPNTDELPVASNDTQPLIQKSNTSKNTIKPHVKPVRGRSISKQKKARGDASTLVKMVLLEKRDASISEIVNRTGVSRGHVSTLRANILQELQAS